MAKEFKDYDRKYQHCIHTLMWYEKSEAYAEFKAKGLLEKWPFEVERHLNSDIRHAVYFDHNAEQWQMFRVSLKGFTTREKLTRLAWRRLWSELNKVAYEDVRIDNYLGALVRGGQLNTKYEVVRD